MTLPFFINDGRVTRKCEYRDLYIIFTLKLSYTVFKKRTWHDLTPQQARPSALVVVYSSLEALLTINKEFPANPMAYVNVVTLMQMENIDKVVCKNLHTMKEKPLVKLMLQIKDIK